MFDNINKFLEHGIFGTFEKIKNLDNLFASLCDVKGWVLSDETQRADFINKSRDIYGEICPVLSDLRAAELSKKNILRLKEGAGEIVVYISGLGTPEGPTESSQKGRELMDCYGSFDSKKLNLRNYIVRLKKQAYRRMILYFVGIVLLTKVDFFMDFIYKLFLQF